MHKSTAYMSALVAIGLFLAVPNVLADTISDRIVISANAATATKTISFNPLDKSFTEADEAAGLTNPYTFFVGVRSGVHFATYDSAVELLEPDGTISDIVDFHLDGTTNPGVQSVTLKFFSDTEGGAALQPPPGAFVVTTPETGGVLQDITSLFLNSHGLPGGDVPATIQIQSDLEAVPTAPVPEPSTLLLLGSGLASLGGAVWRKRRQ